VDSRLYSKVENMRDPKRIPEILKRLEKLWMKNSDLRLGQLIENIFPNRPGFDKKYSRSAYFVEDEDFMEILEKSYGEGMKQNG
jgi:hypothetical protein